MNLRVVGSALVSASLVVGCASSGVPTASPVVSAVASAAPSPPPSPSASVAPSALPSPDLPTPVDIAAAGALTIEATPAIDWVVVVDGQAWIAGPGEGIGIFDKTGTMPESVAVTGQCESMDVGFGAVWSAQCSSGSGGMIRIDAKTKAVKDVDLGEPILDSERSVGAGEGAVWVVAGASSDLLLGVDPTTLRVAHRYAIPGKSAAVRAGLGGVWVTRPDDDQLLHVDPASGKVVATIAVGDGPRFLAVGEGAVWVMNQTNGTVSRVDPKTDTVTATIATSMQIYGGDMAVGGGSVWVRGGPELLFRIDPATDRVTHWYRPDAGSGSAAADDDAVWVTAHDVATIWRLPLK